MTPDEFSFNGRCDASPWNILLPTCRLGYCTSSRLCARSKNTIAATTPSASARKNTRTPGEIEPVRDSSKSCTSAPGRPATMPAKMISDVPLPTPRCVICSPSHIRKIVPPTSVITVVARKKNAGIEHDAACGVARSLETDGDAVALQRRENHRHIARILVDLLPARLAFLFQAPRASARSNVINCMMIDAEM